MTTIWGSGFTAPTFRKAKRTLEDFLISTDLKSSNDIFEMIFIKGRHTPDIKCENSGVFQF